MRQLTLKSVFSALVCSQLLLHVGIGSADELSEAEVQVVEAQVAAAPLDDEGRLVQFERDIAPIFQAHCLQCHGPEDAKNDFRVDDPDSVLDYVEPEDVESSTLYVDYLTIDDDDMLMPPRKHGGPLTAGELALIRVWIEEGAHWPEGYVLAAETDGEAGAAAVPAPAPAPPQSLSERVWAAQGFLHPATIHFPIALFLLGGVFVVLGWKWQALGTQIPLACLLLGTASAIASTLMGWSFASEQGYGTGWNPFDWGREIDVHRWSGVIVTAISSVLAIVALIALRNNSQKLTNFWKIGLLICAAMVGAVGHQGGELSYGKDFYPKAWRILTGASEDVVIGDTQQTNPPIETTADSGSQSFTQARAD